MGNQRLDHLLSKEQSEVIPIWLNSEQSDVGDGDITKELHRTIQFSKPIRAVKSEELKNNLELGLWRTKTGL